MIPPDHPRYRSLTVRESLAEAARTGLVSLEGLAAHGRGEAFDYLLGEMTTASAAAAERLAAELLLSARQPVISVNGNAAALAAPAIADLQEASGAAVEVNLFHRTEARMALISDHLQKHGVTVLSGDCDRLVPLDHDRGLCLPHGIGSADLVLVMLEDGDRCTALRKMNKIVIAIDLNPLSRTAQAATLTIVDELTRALPAITAFCRQEQMSGSDSIPDTIDNGKFLSDAKIEMKKRLD
ncbi:MAG: phosphopantothenate/pantothenate synthetase [Methanocalculus sp. MSAO_Arc1]|uniref:4-phosphopantoate--beta-alanine ligase n=1 Tax=Methanocalculus TaxID=71151 RepID=UPI000FF0A4FA|nr:MULTISPECIES: 4-phosphopantoate--beta-alanine ligase [unclassified Methanocalculus]MCP1661846.1 4-phosphopantoate--beta-alanine ligase [Methanocalculus sp. AMF5]RQD81978.1 MAG: phosphopantothenate/pantothenate synthetase [Methanocalculus sp. MSAO_Arc1]